MISIGLLIGSCNFYLGENRNNDFMEHADCFVYEGDIKTENLSYGKVKYIDPKSSNECAKEQLKNFYLLYLNSKNDYISIINTHPKNLINLIDKVIADYETDSTKLESIIKYNNSIKVDLKKLCKNQETNNKETRYVLWKSIEFSQSGNQYSIISENTYENEDKCN